MIRHFEFPKTLDSVRCQPVTCHTCFVECKQCSCQILWKSFTIPIVCYMASTSPIVLQFAGLLKQGFSLLHVNFAKDLMILKVLRFCFEKVSELHSLVFSKHDTVGVFTKIFTLKCENITLFG